MLAAYSPVVVMRRAPRILGCPPQSIQNTLTSSFYSLTLPAIGNKQRIT
jgi:hypothetical protein